MACTQGAVLYPLCPADSSVGPSPRVPLGDICKDRSAGDEGESGLLVPLDPA